MRKWFAVAIAIVSLVSAGFAQGSAQKKTAAAPTPKKVAVAATTPAPASDPCTAGLDEICPKSEWLVSYDRMMAIQNKYKMPQDEADLVNGMSLRLSQEVPQGYRWDGDKRKFVKNPVATGTAPAGSNQTPTAPAPTVVQPVTPPAGQKK